MAGWGDCLGSTLKTIASSTFVSANVPETNILRTGPGSISDRTLEVSAAHRLERFSINSAVC